MTALAILFGIGIWRCGSAVLEQAGVKPVSDRRILIITAIIAARLLSDGVGPIGTNRVDNNSAEVYTP